MRVWSLHPVHLDRAGLVAGWREALLAQAVLAGRTKGYRTHPQLIRFTATPDPVGAIGAYLRGLAAEATLRGYRFDTARILEPGRSGVDIAVTTGQLAFEWAHLGAKLATRSLDDAIRWTLSVPTAHPLFRVGPGPVASWEIV